MKRVTPSDARKYWFRILDEVVAGEVVVIERNGALVTLRRNESDSPIPEKRPRDYSRLLRIPDADRAETWGWRWSGPAVALKPRSSRGS